MMIKTSNQHDLTIVVNTCDAYEDVLNIFFCALHEYWPDCPYPIVINTESSSYNSHNYPARVHHYAKMNGEDDWGDRLRSTLSSIQTEFVLMIYDDFILNRAVSNKSIQSALQLLLTKKNAVVTYLINTNLPLREANADGMFIQVKDKVDYRLNSAPAIWRRESLKNYTAIMDTPWAWEVFGSYRTWGDGQVFYSLNPNQPDVYSYNHSKGGAIYRGKWVKDVVDQVVNKYNLKIDWNVRGYSSDTIFEKRTLIWKLRFMQTGFRMVGWKAFYFVMQYLRKKLNVL